MMQRETNEIVQTGERYIDEWPMNWELFYQHIGRYLFAQRHVSGCVVLDVACGSGYGTALLAKYARAVVGADVSRDAIAHAVTRYRRSNVSFFQTDCGWIGMRDQSVDVVVSFETLEHVPDMNRFLKELRRVLKPGGTVLISTPNRPLYAVYNKGRSNPYHYQELDAEEFPRLLSEHFQVETVWGQRYFTKRDLPLIRPYAERGVPVGPDGLMRRLVRVALRMCLPERFRARTLVGMQVWAGKCGIGEVPPADAVYMVALVRKS